MGTLDQPVDPGIYMPQQQGGALSFGTPAPNASGFAGYGSNPLMGSLLYGNGPQSPYAKKMDEASDQVLGDPSAYSGALSSDQSQYKAGVQDKLAAIRRAAAAISNTRGTANTPLMKFAAGLSSSPWIGTALGTAFGSAADEINKQREMERLIAEKTGDLDIEGPQTEMGSALQDEGALDKRIQLAGQLENQAGNIQSRADSTYARNLASERQAAARIGAADIAANKNRWQYLGADPQDPNTGIYLDKNSPDQHTVKGPGVAPKTSGSGSNRFETMKQAWLAIHPNDQAGALDYASGHRSLTPQEMYRSARTLAGRELGAGADPQDIEDATNKIYGSMSHPAGADGPPPAGKAPPAGSAPPAGNKPWQASSGTSAQNPARPLSHDDFNKLPSGTYFVNPADGKVMQKK